MANVDIKPVRDVENAVRDLKNWLAVFKTEYDVADEAVKILHQKVDEFSDKLRAIKCDASGKVNADSVKPVSNTLRDAKAWLATFAKEYDLAEEAVRILHENFDKVGDKLRAVECK